MGKLTIGLWVPSASKMYFLKGPSEHCRKIYGDGLTREQYEKHTAFSQQQKEDKNNVNTEGQSHTGI